MAKEIKKDLVGIYILCISLALKRCNYFVGFYATLPCFVCLFASLFLSNHWLMKRKQKGIAMGTKEELVVYIYIVCIVDLWKKVYLVWRYLWFLTLLPLFVCLFVFIRCLID